MIGLLSGNAATCGSGDLGANGKLAVLRPLGRMVNVGVLGPDHADIDVRPFSTSG